MILFEFMIVLPIYIVDIFITYRVKYESFKKLHKKLIYFKLLNGYSKISGLNEGKRITIIVHNI